MKSTTTILNTLLASLANYQVMVSESEKGLRELGELEFNSVILWSDGQNGNHAVRIVECGRPLVQGRYPVLKQQVCLFTLLLSRGSEMDYTWPTRTAFVNMGLAINYPSTDSLIPSDIFISRKC